MKILCCVMRRRRGTWWSLLTSQMCVDSEGVDSSSAKRRTAAGPGDNGQRLSYPPGTRRMTVLPRQNPHLFTCLFLTESVPSPSFTNRWAQSRCLLDDRPYIRGGHPKISLPHLSLLSATFKVRLDHVCVRLHRFPDASCIGGCSDIL